MKFKYFAPILLSLLILGAGCSSDTSESYDSSSTGSEYSCDCSKTCPNMSSCAEAYYQLDDCGCSIRDGDNDGVPCENICSGG